MCSKPSNIDVCYVDADIVAYRASAGTEDVIDPSFVFPTSYEIPKCDIPMIKGRPEDTIKKVDILMQYIVDETVVFPNEMNFKSYLTGGGNFRYDLAKIAPYKGNRKNTVKPTNLPVARQHLQENWGAEVSVGEEADDLISIAVTQSFEPVKVVCSIDKDFLQLPCWHFNFVKGTWTEVSVDEGNKFFYTQVLTGDPADNIKGLHRVGPKKAEKILEGATTEYELYQKCLEAYGGDAEKLLENARLLWLRRYEGELWECPIG